METAGEGTAQPRRAGGLMSTTAAPAPVGQGGWRLDPWARSALLCSSPLCVAGSGPVAQGLEEPAVWGSGGGPRTRRRHVSGQGCQARFGPSHSKEVLRTCLGLICGYRERVCHSGRVCTRKRREGRGARVTEPEGALLGSAGPCFPSPCPSSLAHGWGRRKTRLVSHLVRVGSGSCG
ncbi:unnamed protein product, partial [Gulo gulo]